MPRLHAALQKPPGDQGLWAHPLQRLPIQNLGLCSLHKGGIKISQRSKNGIVNEGNQN